LPIAANTNDTVKVWPGYYEEGITLNKNITLMGSGYENTIIRGNYNPIVTVSSGRLQWFQITSFTGNGIDVTGGIVRNCVIRDCAGNGIISTSGNGTVLNCVIANNAGHGISATDNGVISAINCISRSNNGNGFYKYSYGTAALNVSYSNGSRSYYTSGGQGCIDLDPLFVSNTDFHISEGSPSWNTGITSLLDADGSRSDMGYFGGPDCPIYPVVTQIIISPGGNTINLSAKARANY
jgi:hypothetical protein